MGECGHGGEGCVYLGRPSLFGLRILILYRPYIIYRWV
jgi:hypothetical protein